MSNLAAGNVYETPLTAETGRCVLVVSDEPVREVHADGGATYVPDPAGDVLVIDGYLSTLMVRAADPRITALARVLTGGTPVDPNTLCTQLLGCDWHTVRTVAPTDLLPVSSNAIKLREVYTRN